MQQAGEDCCGHLGGEVGEGSTAAGHGVDAQGTQALAELGGGDGLAGHPAGEQPPGAGRGSHPGVCPAVAYQLMQGRAEGSGNRDVMLAEADEHCVVAAGDLAGGEGGDAG